MLPWKCIVKLSTHSRIRGKTHFYSYPYSIPWHACTHLPKSLPLFGKHTRTHITSHLHTIQGNRLRSKPTYIPTTFFLTIALKKWLLSRHSNPLTIFCFNLVKECASQTITSISLLHLWHPSTTLLLVYLRLPLNFGEFVELDGMGKRRGSKYWDEFKSLLAKLNRERSEWLRVCWLLRLHNFDDIEKSICQKRVRLEQEAMGISVNLASVTRNIKMRETPGHCLPARLATEKKHTAAWKCIVKLIWS